MTKDNRRMDADKKKGLQRVLRVSQLFIKRTKQNEICSFLAKATTDFHLVGNWEEMKMFVDDISRGFVVGKVVLDGKIHFDVCEVVQDLEDIDKMSMM